MATNQLHGGPLDGVEIHGLPGPVAGVVLLYLDAETNLMASALGGVGLDPRHGDRVVRKTFSMMLESLSRGCHEFGIDAHELLAEIDAKPPSTPSYIAAELLRREPGGQD